MNRGHIKQDNSNLFKYILLAIVLVGLGTLIYFSVKNRPEADEDLYSFMKKKNLQPNSLPIVTTDTVGQTMRGMQQLISKKDQMITELENQLDAFRKDTFFQQSPLSAMPLQSDAEKFIYYEKQGLQTRLEETENKISELNYTINKLKKENEQLASPGNKPDRSDTKNSSWVADSLKRKTFQLEKVNAQLQKSNDDLGRKLKDLDAELGFEKIDCNLARADVNQIISNSKQRKELLAQALSALNNLSKSGDPVVRDKAKEKFIKLESITRTVRD